MLKSFLFSLYLVFLAWQVAGAEDLSEATLPEFEEEDFGISEFNETDNDSQPQPRFIQVRVNQKSYTFNFVAVNWHTARELCTAQNQVLASVQSYDDNLELLQAMLRYGMFYSDATFWIGGSQLGHIGQWSWASTGKPVIYTSWKNRPQSDSYCNRHCMEVTTDGRWNANDCDLKRGVICEDLPACS